MKIAIVGAGNMGTATAYPLADNGHQVNLIGTHLDNAEIRWCLEHGEHPRLKRPLQPCRDPDRSPDRRRPAPCPPDRFLTILVSRASALT